MVLPFMISDDADPASQNSHTSIHETYEREKKAELTRTKRRSLICILLLASLITANISYNLWAKEGTTPIRKIFTANIIYDLWTKKVTAVKPGTVVGILHNAEKPCALINRELVHEGDITNGVKIIKIDREKVEFEKNGQRWTQKILAHPNPAWQKTAK